MRVRLLPVDGGHPIDISHDLLVVGRGEECDLRLPHKSVSKMHCVIVKTDGLLLLRDLGSTNGTRVNGQRVRRAALLPNDLLNIASLKYQVEFAQEVAGEPIPEPTQKVEAELSNPAVQDAEPKDLPPAELPAIQTNQLPDVYSDDDQPLSDEDA